MALKKFRLALIALMVLGLASLASAQTGASQSFTIFVNAAPPAILNSQTFSNSTNTGVSTATTGGTVAAGTYRVCVTFFTLTNTETPCSTDTAATSVVTTTGSTSTLTVQAPVAVGIGSNVVGYRVYVGASAGASGAETLQTLTSTICTLSASSTASCALTSPAVFTSSANFVGGGGGPATPGTALTPPVSNAANTATFENASLQFHTLTWVLTGTAPSACTVQLQSGSTVAGLTNIGQSLTCTSAGSYALPLLSTANFWAANVSAFTAGDTTTKMAFTIVDSPNYPYLTWGNATPTGNCTNGTTFSNSAAASASTVVYVCQPANTWNPITVP